MSERTPLDPWGGSVNHFPIPEECSRSQAESTISYVAMELGVGIEFLPNETPEDSKFIDALTGFEKTLEEEAKEGINQLENMLDGIVLTKMKAEMPHSISFLARLPIEEGGNPEPNYELMATKLHLLHIGARQLLRRDLN